MLRGKMRKGIQLRFHNSSEILKEVFLSSHLLRADAHSGFHLSDGGQLQMEERHLLKVNNSLVPIPAPTLKRDVSLSMCVDSH